MLNTGIFLFIVHYQEAHTLNYFVHLETRSKAWLILKNHDNKCFLWCHIRYLNPLKIHPTRILKTNKNIVHDLDYESIKFPVSRKDFGKIEKKNNTCINVLRYETKFVYTV